MRILIIEDDKTLNGLLDMHLQRQGYEVAAALSGSQGLSLAEKQTPDLVILDIMMPGMDGWTVCRQLKESSNVPILMLTAKTLPEDVIRGLKLGADDYVRKPFYMEELLLRVEAILRRTKGSRQPKTEVYEDEVLRIDLERQLVQRKGKGVRLTPTEYRLLAHLVRNRDRVVPHEELLTTVWGPQYAQDTAVLSVYIRYLRQKLEDQPDQPRYIKTAWGIGYRFEPAIEHDKHAETQPSSLTGS